MSVEIVELQYYEIIDKLTQLLNTVADKQTQQQILSLIDTIRSLMAKETKQDTIISSLGTIGTKLDQILDQLGAPKPTYSAVVTASSVAANKHHIALVNGSTSVIAVRRIALAAEVTATVTGFPISYRVARVTGVSGGTSIAVQKYDTNDPDPPSGVSVVANPTSATVVGVLDNITINPEETGGQHFVERIYGAYGIKPIVLRSGQALSVQQYGTAGVGTLTAVTVFTVE